MKMSPGRSLLRICFDYFGRDPFAFPCRLNKGLLHLGNGRAAEAEQVEHHLGVTGAGPTAQRVGSGR